jgi:hypothetical protein
MNFIYNDGGRTAAGFKGSTGDCVARAVAIASGRDYATVCNELAAGNAAQRRSKRSPEKRGRTGRDGINTKRKWFSDYMQSLGFVWTSTMSIGSGCKVRLRDDELPKGRLLVSVSKHVVAVIDGVIHDTYDPCRTRVASMATGVLPVRPP